MKILSSFLILTLISFHSAFGQNAVQDAVTVFKNNSLFANASISFYAIDLTTGNAIAEYNSNVSLPPASPPPGLAANQQSALRCCEECLAGAGRPVGGSSFIFIVLIVVVAHAVSTVHPKAFEI